MHETQKQKHETQQEIFSLNDMFVVEWSEQQKCFHVDNYTKSVLKNIDDYVHGKPLHFATIGIMGSEDEAWNLVENLQAERAELTGETLPDEIAGLATFADSVFELVPPKQEPPPFERADSKKQPLASAARNDHFEPTPLGDGRDIIPYKRR